MVVNTIAKAFTNDSIYDSKQSHVPTPILPGLGACTSKGENTCPTRREKTRGIDAFPLRHTVVSRLLLRSGIPPYQDVFDARPCCRWCWRHRVEIVRSIFIINEGVVRAIPP